MKKIIAIFLLGVFMTAGCASMEALQKKKANLEKAIRQQEKATKEEIASIEAEIDGIVAVIDSSNSFSDDAKNNEKISQLQGKVNGNLIEV